ncbi:hypothetical protein [uncultured Halomonas sp.]|uniref:hypothetical protein n=1 Tax=uncultured Halomonas sp. TaxID=173971 RepID=UPI0026267104|nr:hypothetical protein [uncultured Halomonas sp.]
MTLRTHPLALTSSDQTVLTVPPGQEATCNSILVTGTGDLTLKYKEASTGDTHTIFDGKSVTDEIALERSFNLSSGDELIASGDGLGIFVSAYYVGTSSGSATLVYGPGPQQLIAGDMSAGLFGEVSASELFTGEELAFRLGVTEGTIHNSDTRWLKFARNGKVIYGPMRTIMHSVSWDHLYSRGLVYGTDDEGTAPRGTPTNQYTTVERGGYRFLVSLFTGANADPFDDTDERFYTDDMHELNIGGGSEWNELWYRVHEDVPSDPDTDGLLATRHGGPQSGGNWASYTNSELNVGTGNGRSSWCQEQSLGAASRRVHRGADGVAHFFRSTASNTTSSRGWRPRLELIPNH